VLTVPLALLSLWLAAALLLRAWRLRGRGPGRDPRQNPGRDMEPSA
jgi:hypothetical protein